MSVFLHTDVTAVSLYKCFVLAGNGSYVNIFQTNSNNLLCKILVLRGQKIYGFVPLGNRILVYGGKQFSVLSYNNENGFTTLTEPFICDDWLHSGLWNSDNYVSLLTAHNVVQKWNIENKTLMSQTQSKENSILYSGLLLTLDDGVLVFAGTVFSEVIIHYSGCDMPLHRLIGHRGVIFSISCDTDKGLIVTTSDDRSVRIWSVLSKHGRPFNISYWQNAEIICKHEVYGHMARVMRSCITDSFIASVGEDAAICFWDYNGGLIKKIVSHQNGCIWSIDSNERHLVTGGGDCGVSLYPLTIATTSSKMAPLECLVDSPKKVLFTSRKNLIILNDSSLFYYDFTSKTTAEFKLNHKSTYKLISISSCKQIIALCDMSGKLDIFVENCKDSAYLTNIIDTELQIGKILSMQWAYNRYLVMCSDNGTISILARKLGAVEIYGRLSLPNCKERWLTASAICPATGVIVVGDRCGNIHFYFKDQMNPMKTFNKVHGRYGPTSITIRNNDVVTTGRDGSIKHFLFNNDISDIKYMHCKKFEFQWVEKFLDRQETVVCGFQERIFVVYDMKSESKLLEVPCGGGHRSWDAARLIKKQGVDDIYSTYINLVFIKNSDILFGSYNMDEITATNLVHGSHTKEINCLQTLKYVLKTFYISGGEDTSLRISSLNSEYKYRDEYIFKQLSNVRTLRTCTISNNKVLLVSGGGRAQICAKMITLQKNELQVEDLIEYLIKGTDRERKGTQTWRNCSIDFDPETRIMDLEILKINDEQFLIVAGCSDGYLRWYRLTYNSNVTRFVPIRDIKSHETCILQTKCISYLDKRLIVSCTTRGQVAFWDVNAVESNENEIKPVFTTETTKSGINCFSARVLSNSQLLIATGGDDNSIQLCLLDIPDHNNLKTIQLRHFMSLDKIHCSQITGLFLLKDCMITTSIDQRVSLCSVNVTEEGISSKLVTQTFSDVPDIQGMEIVDESSESVTVCVFGKGIEVIKIRKDNL